MRYATPSIHVPWFEEFTRQEAREEGEADEIAFAYC